MKKVLLFLIMTFACGSITFGQTAADSIAIKKVSGGYQFLQNGKVLTMPQLENAIKPNEEAFKLLKSAKSNNTISSIFAGIGGGLIGYPIGTALGGGEPIWTMALIGLGCVAIAIPISINSTKQFKSAVTTYNSGLKSSSYNEKPVLNLCVSGNGIGVLMRF